MPHCDKCGNEIDEDVTFCPNCGANVKAQDIVYRRPRSSGRNAITILALLFGGIIIIASLGILAGGGMVMWAQNTFRDPDGFLTSGEVNLQVDSYAMVLQDIDIGGPVACDHAPAAGGEVAPQRLRLRLVQLAPKAVNGYRRHVGHPFD